MTKAYLEQMLAELGYCMENEEHVGKTSDVRFFRVVIDTTLHLILSVILEVC